MIQKRQYSYIIGIDFSSDYAVVSTSKYYQVPYTLIKKADSDEWLLESEANNTGERGEAYVKDVLRKAIQKESIFLNQTVYTGEQLLVIFIKKLLMLSGIPSNGFLNVRMVFTMKTLSRTCFDLFATVCERLNLGQDQWSLIDYKESFSHYVVHQSPEIWKQDVCLMLSYEEMLHMYLLTHDTDMSRTIVGVTDEVKNQPFRSGQEQIFSDILTGSLQGRSVSAIYLVGDEFENDWLKASLGLLCQGRRAFMGKNLFSKGAFFAAEEPFDHEGRVIYLGEDEMKFSLSLRLYDGAALRFYDLIQVGNRWYESSASCEVILAGSPEVDFWKRFPNQKEAVVETLQLSGLPERPEKTTRLKIQARATSDKTAEISITDSGFGELFPGTGKKWKYETGL